jgi:DNA-binding MarR family transcriptional regulator
MTDPIELVRYYWPREQAGDGDSFLAMSSVLRLHQLMIRNIERELKPLQLSLTGYLLLMTLLLSERGSRLLSRLARNLIIHPTTVTLTVDRLEGQQLVVRSPHPTDRRATCVSITCSGRALARQATARLQSVNFGLLAADPARLAQTVQLLATVRTALGDTDQPR